jgi:hypothetical protein
MKYTDIPQGTDPTTLVGLLTLSQKDSLVGVQYTQDCYYNPIQDASDNWVISTQEIASTTNPDTLWVQTLELIPYVPKPAPPFPPLN